MGFALEAAAAYDGVIDVVLSDVVMPRLSGPDMVLHLKKARPSIRVVLMTGYADESLFERAAERSDLLLRKPFRPNSAIEKIRELCGELEDDRKTESITRRA